MRVGKECFCMYVLGGECVCVGEGVNVCVCVWRGGGVSVCLCKRDKHTDIDRQIYADKQTV